MNTNDFDKDQKASTAGQSSSDSMPDLIDAESDAGQTTAARLRRAAGHAMPTLLTIVALAGLFYWGHRYEWTFVPVGGSPARGSAAADWCAAHNVPESICIACNARLMPKGKLYGWCAIHGVHECVLCNPQLAQLSEPPDVRADVERVARALAVRPRAENNPECRLHLRRIQFASDEDVERAGIAVEQVHRAHVRETIRVPAQAMYDPMRYARVGSRVGGTVCAVLVRVGDRVEPGQVLLLIDSQQVGDAKMQLLQAAAQWRLRQQVVERLARAEDVVAGRARQEAETALAEAAILLDRAVLTLANFGLPITRDDVVQRELAELSSWLQTLGVPADVAERLSAGGSQANLIAVTAPRAGIVVRQQAVVGQVVAATEALCDVVDIERMWLMLDVPVEQLRYVRPGMDVDFRADVHPVAVRGKVAWISTEIDRQTRTAAVRVEVANPDGQLRDGMFGTAELVLRDDPQAMVVPSEAVHWDGCCHVVFVRDKNFLKPGAFKVFHTRVVRPGVAFDGQTEIIAGVLPGEWVVTDGGGGLRGELLKGNLGAG